MKCKKEVGFIVRNDDEGFQNGLMHTCRATGAKFSRVIQPPSENHNERRLIIECSRDPNDLSSIATCLVEFLIDDGRVFPEGSQSGCQKKDS